MLASITRLRIRSLWFLPQFFLHTSRSGKQARSSPGCLGVNVRKTQGLTFWTLSVWESEDSLRAFLAQAPHRSAMPKLFHWCDEAAVAHWAVTTREIPDWPAATAKLLQHGRLSRVRNPSALQREGSLNVT